MAKKPGAGVQPRGNKIRISYQHNGRRYFETLDRRPTKTNLEYAARERQNRIDRLRAGFDLEGDRDNPTFARLAQDYLDNAAVELATLESYKNILNRYWLPHIGALPVRSIRYRDLLAGLNANDFQTTKTRNNALVPLRQVFRLAMADDLLDKNPADKLRQARRQKPAPDPILPGEWQKIREQLSGDALVFFSLIWETGLRTPGEVNALEWTDYQGDRLVIDKALSRRALKGTKTGKAREVLLTPAAVALLDDFRGFRQRGPIFRNSQGGPHLDGDIMNGHWKTALSAAGVRYRRAYNLRHGYASRALSAGMNPAFLAKQLGHSLQMLLTVYAKWIDDSRDRSELAKLDAAAAE